MNFLELAKNRQSVRKYSDKKIEKEKIELCLEAASLSPSASNSQPWKFIIVDEPELKRKVANATVGPVRSFNKFAIQAPVIVAIVIQKPKFITQVGWRVKEREFPLIDIGIAAEQFCLQATELGIGTCMLGWFNEKEIKGLLNIPINKRIGLLITLGYAVDGYRLRKKIRKDFSVICSYNSY